VNPDAVYTTQDVDRMVQEALAQRRREKPVGESPSPVRITVKIPKPKPKSSGASSSTQVAKSRQPLSKAEREQLAAELRLRSVSDDATLHLLADRINQ
ncbi:MAG TPA: hypothetical protein VGC73_12545, partial [Pyrinomonadaceae bacterium]